MTEAFERAVARVRIYEGNKYTNHPDDPGGPTKYGVTLADVRRFIDRHATAKTVKLLTWEQAKEVYRLHYWQPIHGDKLPWPVNFLVFDMGINSGISRGVKLAQRIVGVEDDGLLGPVTLKALNAVDPKEFNDKYAVAREAYYRSLKRLFKTFGDGWLNRTKDAHEVASLPL